MSKGRTIDHIPVLLVKKLSVLSLILIDTSIACTYAFRHSIVRMMGASNPKARTAALQGKINWRGISKHGMVAMRQNGSRVHTRCSINEACVMIMVASKLDISLILSCLSIKRTTIRQRLASFLGLANLRTYALAMSSSSLGTVHGSRHVNQLLW